VNLVFLWVNSFLPSFFSFCFIFCRFVGVFLISLWFSNQVLAESVKSGLGLPERIELISDLSSLATMKVGGNPYPLGGHEGVQLLMTGESLLKPLNDRIYESTSLPPLMKLHFAKGLFQDFDLVASLIPEMLNSEFSGFTLGLQWSFWELTKRPLHFSLRGQSGFYRWSDQLSLRVQTLQILANLYLSERVNFYVGLGPHTAQGDFNGGPRTITDSQEVQSLYFQSYQVLGGGALQIAEWMVTSDLILYPSMTLSLGLGTRF
jgi:hypothetical protein